MSTSANTSCTLLLNSVQLHSLLKKSSELRECGDRALLELMSLVLKDHSTILWYSRHGAAVCEFPSCPLRSAETKSSG